MGLFGRSVDLSIVQDPAVIGGQGGASWYYGYTWAGKLPRRTTAHVVFTCSTSYEEAADDGVQPGMMATVVVVAGGVVLTTGMTVGSADISWAPEVARFGGSTQCSALILGERWQGYRRTEIHVLLLAANANLNVGRMPPATTQIAAAGATSAQPAPHTSAPAGQGLAFDLWGWRDFFNENAVGKATTSVTSSESSRVRGPRSCETRCWSTRRTTASTATPSR